MNPTLIASLREQLEKKQMELNERLARIKKDIAGGLEADSSEQATQLENAEVLDSLANEATSELAQINGALQRMEEGSYGVCTRCGNEIDARRLEARPYAARCIACASEA